MTTERVEVRFDTPHPRPRKKQGGFRFGFFRSGFRILKLILNPIEFYRVQVNPRIPVISF